MNLSPVEATTAFGLLITLICSIFLLGFYGVEGDFYKGNNLTEGIFLTAMSLGIVSEIAVFVGNWCVMLRLVKQDNSAGFSSEESRGAAVGEDG